jgi:hypothetical protein
MGLDGNNDIAEVRPGDYNLIPVFFLKIIYKLYKICQNTYIIFAIAFAIVFEFN